MNLKSDISVAVKREFVAGTLKKYKYLYLMLVPFLLWYVMFSFKPLFWLQLAFKDYNIFQGLEGSPWVGLKHFREFFSNPYFFRVMRNTLLINIYQIVFCFTAQIVLALMLNELKNIYLKKTIQTITYLPYFISTVVVAGIITTMLAPNNGVVNIIIKKLGGNGIYFLTRPEWFRTIYISMMLWTSTGYGTIVYIAALAGIDQQLYEACALDGGGKLKQLIHITLPGIIPTIVIMLIMRIGSLLSVGYESIILLYQPATYETADVISSYVYRLGFEGKPQYDLAVAVDMFNSVVGMILVIGANTLSKRVTDAGLW